ncbi:MAG: superoxide dismutase family protein [Chloroflexi bacterium]|nr:superoxide dismutase family protein [Chloroflexota bacterium]
MRQAILAVLIVGLLITAGLVVVAQEATPEATADATAEATAGAETTTGAEATAEATTSAVMSGGQADILDVNGNTIGQMILVDAGNGKTVIQIQVTNLPPGWHGFHLHETGTCDAAGDQPFASAGGHWTMGGEAHPNHTGDMPPLLTGQDGTARLAFETDRFTIGDLFDADGTAVVIHANPDNLAHIPERYGTPDEETLDACDGGDRLACGVVMEAAPAQ